MKHFQNEYVKINDILQASEFYKSVLQLKHECNTSSFKKEST